MNIQISERPEQLVAACAEHLISVLAESIEARGRARIALAGGSTPKSLYDHLASPALANRIDWGRVDCYFGDERAVPQGHPDSNFGMAQRHLFVPLGLPRDNQFPMISAPMGDLDAEADRYQALLAEWAEPEGPVFDLMLNGMGTDGHFASLFPGTPALTERDRWVVVNPVPQLSTQRLTLTFPVFERARHVCFLTAGADKRPAFQAIRQPDSDLPCAQLVRRRPTDWFVDRACTDTSD
ncbi:6-phosphogluconolactonase [Halothiobacillus diazotrophicus]|uniref:6-phosphogluconolactonase n=1 Tax=Halothiobacillus diazotrophicus TaxID=1860122 RepID=A0A191ZGL4_9GAMM|nr:6-phosphogluconolactonase [Halothiobacillus diazotrophicus]ANJ66997.1 6-phosphogluconolactonase [Halothiobacillus diazotrophicus]